MTIPNDRTPAVPLFVRAEQRIRELEEALAHTRAVTDAERRRADLAVRAAEEAYRRAAVSRASVITPRAGADLLPKG